MHAKKCGAESSPQLSHLGVIESGQQDRNSNHCVSREAQGGNTQNAEHPSLPPGSCFGNWLGPVPPGEIRHERLAQWEDGFFLQLCQAARVLQQIEHPGMRHVCAFHLLDFELLRPGDHGPPDELIQQHNDSDHGENAQ